MKKWEYRAVIDSDSDRLNTLKAEGWENVAVVKTKNNELIYFFTRQLKEDK